MDCSKGENMIAKKMLWTRAAYSLQPGNKTRGALSFGHNMVLPS